MTIQIPTAAFELGTPTAEYRRNSRNVKFSLVFSVILAIICGFFALAGLMDQEWGIFGIGAFFGALCVWWFIGTYRNKDMQVLVFKEGLAYTKQELTNIVRWPDITAVYQNVTKHYRNGIYTGTTHVYTIQCANGQKYTFNDALAKVENLGNTIQQEAFRHIFPRLIEQYNAGQTVSFGKLSISKAGIANKKETLPWNKIEGIQLTKGIISVKKEGKWLKWSTATVGQTPNIFVFTTMVDQIVGLNRKK
ncbi:MAG: hypothetical protein GY943_04100 [Chloroflexi bacterium]|nr:hypothetical protein [Chloroflexota bacterium]